MLFFLIHLFAFPLYAAKPDFDFFCKQLLQKDPQIESYAKYFTPGFQKAVSEKYLKQIFKEVYQDVGKCLSYKTILLSPGKYILTLRGDKKIEVNFSATYDEEQNLFSGLLLKGITDSSLQIKKWEDVKKSLKKLDTQDNFSATLMTLDKKIHLTYNSNKPFAIGSTFKLYILGALEKSIQEGKHQWEEILPMKEEWKSLPSGIMHTWPTGKEVTLYEYAEKMISISDNTATDHLLNFLTRNKVEEMLLPMGNSSESSYLPFLSTLEIFKLKWGVDPVEAKEYLQKNKEERLLFLEKLKTISREQVGTNHISMETPTLIDKLEWFASTQENCQAMFYLASQKGSQIRSILAKNIPFDLKTSSHHWSYVGYKGGSEPGVLNMTYLLESKKGSQACLAMSWNNKSKNISQARFFDIVKKTLVWAETQVL